MEAVIRVARLEDAPAMAHLAGELGYPTTTQELTNRLTAILGMPDHAVYVAEVCGQQVIGWTHVHGMHLIEAVDFADLGGLIINASFRSQGIGKQLLEAAESWTISQGYAYLRVRSNILRERAHRFYHRAGYRVVKSQHVFIKFLPVESNAEENSMKPDSSAIA